MFAVTIDLPESVRESFQEQEPELLRLTLEALAVEGYRRAALSGSQVGEILGLDYWQTRAFLSEHKVYPQYDIEDFKQDLATLELLRQKQA